MHNHLLVENQSWHYYNGEELSTTNDVHVFKIDALAFAANVKPYLIMSPAEKEKAEKFRHKTDKESYMVARCCLRLLLSKFTGLSPDQIEYSYTKNKKPYISNTIHFNLSHHQHHVLIAISSQAIGIDVEQHLEDFDFTTILESCFIEEEIRFIHQGPQPSLNFYTLWTRKEALLKATGEGLIDNLTEVSSLDITQTRGENRYQLYSWLCADQAIVSLAKPISSNPVKLWLFSPLLTYA